MGAVNVRAATWRLGFGPMAAGHAGKAPRLVGRPPSPPPSSPRSPMRRASRADLPGPGDRGRARNDGGVMGGSRRNWDLVASPERKRILAENRASLTEEVLARLTPSERLIVPRSTEGRGPGLHQEAVPIATMCLPCSGIDKDIKPNIDRRAPCNVDPCQETSVEWSNVRNDDLGLTNESIRGICTILRSSHKDSGIRIDAAVIEAQGRKNAIASKRIERREAARTKAISNDARFVGAILVYRQGCRLAWGAGLGQRAIVSSCVACHRAAEQ